MSTKKIERPLNLIAALIDSPRPLRAVSAMFLIGYGSLRFGAEFFRTPDPGIFGTLAFGLSTAQWLCVPMVIIGAVVLRQSKRGT